MNGLLKAIFIAGLFVGPVFANAQFSQPFSKSELESIVRILVDSGRLKETTRIARVAIATAGKGNPARQASVSLVEPGGSFDVLLDVGTESLLKWEPVRNGRAPVLSEEWARASAHLKMHPEWQNAMALRGYTSTDDIFCESLSAGYFPKTPSVNRRVIKMPCYDVSASTTNIYGRPIEGLIATVDAWTGEVLELLDEGATPVPEPALQPPVAEGLPELAGPGDFRLENNRISFGAWDLNVRLDDQFGLIVSDAGFTHNNQRRSILSEGHISEMFVPYMDPKESWAFRTYLDAGEFGLGTLTSPLLRGTDCPQEASFLTTLTLSPLGRVMGKPDAICVFTRDLAGPLWRHYEALNGLHTGLAGRELVVRSIASIAHYDYVMDWVFRPQGEIEIRIGATGIDAVKAVKPEEPDDPHGRLVTRQLSAVYHDHFFSLRLDLDIDGAENRLVREHVRQETERNGPSERSYWVLEPEVVETEGPLQVAEPGVWRIESLSRQNATGAATAYQLMTEGTVSLLAVDDFPQRRGAFSGSPLWVTRYSPGERAAAGRYPNQSPGGAGLPLFANGENTEAADLILWPTIGFRHITRPEDWPVLSTVWKSVRLRPYGFFDGNPTVRHDAPAD